MNEMAANLSYLRRLAHAGRGKPAPFLPLMAMFGGGYGLSFLLVYLAAILEGALGEGPLSWAARIVFIVAHLLFLAGCVWTGWSLFLSRGRGLSRVASAAWSAAFIAMVTAVAAFFIYSRNEPANDAVYSGFMLPAILLVLWGAAWWTSALASDRRSLLVVALSSFGAAVMAAVIGNSPALLLLTGLCLLSLAFLPALLLMRDKGA